MEKPVNSRNSMLNPMMHMSDSREVSLCSLKALYITIPGTKVRKAKPIICRKIGIDKFKRSSAIEPISASCIENTTIKNFLILQLIISLRKYIKPPDQIV
jgi:hypothetical protein